MQIVDNLHLGESNRNVLKPSSRAPAKSTPTPASAWRAPARSPPAKAVAPNGHGVDTIGVLQLNSLPTLVQRELERMILAGGLPAGGKLKAAAKTYQAPYYQVNLPCHDLLVQLPGNAKLVLTYRRLVNELHLYRRTALAQAGAVPLSSHQHRDIVEKIAARQAVAAGRALYEHVIGSRERMHQAAGLVSSKP